MHENREISWTSWSSDQGRPAKAINRTADMSVQEKSDCAVLPVNQPNKEGQPSAEVAEGRAQTKENIVPSCMRPTQSGKRMSQGLLGVRPVRRYSSIVRAVCVNAPVRICAAGDQRWSSLPRQFSRLSRSTWTKNRRAGLSAGLTALRHFFFPCFTRSSRRSVYRGTIKALRTNLATGSSLQPQSHPRS
jgi:hypothetical protein